MSFELLPIIGTKVWFNGKPVEFKKTLLQRIFRTIWALIGFNAENTAVLVARTYAGRGTPDQKISLVMLHPELLIEYWGVNISVDGARNVANQINKLCDEAELK